MALPEAWLNELMSKNDIASVVSEYIQLTPRGGRLWGHCPFHADKKPSLSVTPDKQLFHCFSCKAGGSVIQFIMQVENLSYIDAIRNLAQRAGMDMPDEIDDKKLLEQKRRRELIYQANREAALFYCKALFSSDGGGARRYLEKRGVSAETAKRFGLGFSPDGFDGLYKHLTALGYSRDTLIDAGLVIPGRKDPSQSFDFFRGRLMFPVISASGRVIAFGGRTMGNDEPKYINTGDTPVYNKRENIYGINLLKGKKIDDIIMVEGYMDVIALHQYGIDNAVASLGTALTSQQARLLKRYASKVYYAYDGDEAGQKAMLRGIDILSSAEIEPRVIVIPDGNDPDEYIRGFGSDSFLSLKDSSITGVRFKLERMAKLSGIDTPDGRDKFAKEACALLATLDPVERDRYIPYVSETSGIIKETIREQCGIPVRAAANKTVHARYNNYKKPKADNERIGCEKKLLSCIMTSPDAGNSIGRGKNFSLSLFSSKNMRSFCARLLAMYSTSTRVDIPLMLAELEGDASDEVSSAYAAVEDIADPVSCAEDIIAKLKFISLKAELSELSEKAKAADSPDKKADIIKEYSTKYALLQTLSKQHGELI